jgi:hypothetical protein
LKKPLLHDAKVKIKDTINANFIDFRILNIFSF